MELPNIGQQCAVLDCKQLDFLPFVCKCKLVFCREHFTEHQEICCNNMVEHREIDIQKRISSYECSEGGCKEKSIVPLICTKCNKHYCISHRHTSGSGCEKLDEVQLQKAIEKSNVPKAQFQEAKNIVDNEVQQTLENARRKIKNVETANKVQLMRLKAKATGLKSISIVDRLYFLIFNDKYCSDGRAVYISSDWNLGRSIDAIAEECKMPNNNNKATAAKLRLFKKIDKKMVTSDMTVKMSLLITLSVVVNGEHLILDYFCV